MSNKIKVLKEYQDGLILQWNMSIWIIRPDGDQPSLWPVALIGKTDDGKPKFIIPKGTDIANANAVLSVLGLPDLF